MRFVVPKNMARNYDDFLQTDACRDMRYCKDMSKEQKSWVPFRAELSPIGYKSKQYSSDNAFNIRFSLKEEIQKGDVIEYEGKQYLVTWNINNDKHDSKRSIIEMMPFELVFRRKSLAKPTANSMTGEIMGYSADDTLCTTRAMNVYGSHLEVRLKTGQPGLFASSRYTVTFQANEETLKIKVDDYFELMGNQYVVRDILYNQLNYDSKTGLIIVEAEKGIVPNGK